MNALFNKTYKCQVTPSGVLSFKFQYAGIRLEACYSLFSFRKTVFAPFLWTHGCNGGVEVYFKANCANSTHFSPVVENLGSRHL